MRDTGNHDLYVGQVERDPQGNLWAVLYVRGEAVTRRSVSSLRRGRKCVSDLVLSAADNYPTGPVSLSTTTAQLLVDQQSLARPLPRAGLATTS